MNSEIEQRIVAMYFDNKDFEKNAQQTIGTLGQLKENLKLEDSVKGFDELEKAGKKLNLNQAKTTVNNLKTALGGLGSAIQKAFNIGTAPIHALDNFFGTFRSYVGKFVGFDLASKFVNSLESALQQLTVAPIQAGWQMYQANVDSTKTIMSGTMKSYKEEMSKVNADWTYDEAEHMEFVKKHLRDLSDYAAQTVFSLSDMTSNVGKFTNQNIDLETSVTAMKGIANMTAKAGQGAQQASMAMYNFSQALGVGKMTTLDWKSIETANIATTELKDMFIMCAAAAGKLQKEVETIDGKEVDKFFITVDKNGKKLARNNWLEVSAENFRDTLQQGWLDKDTMLHVMQLYSNEGFDLDTLAAWGFDIHDEKLMKQLEEIGRSAMEAATQVRTFSKMWDALTESVQSSWADSMELIFGDMTEATTFWSTINDKIGGIMDSIGKNRNDMLREWRGETWDEESQAWIRLENSYDGREDLINGIYGIIDAAQSLGGAFSSAWSEVFGNLTGKKLQEITKGFREFIDGFKGWLGDMDDSNSRLSKIRNGLTGVFSVLKVIWEVVKNVFGVLKEAVKPLIEPIINLFSKFGKWIKLDNVKNLGEMLGTLRDRFSQLWSKLSGLGWSGVFGKIGEVIGNLWSQIREGVSRFLEDNGLGGVADWFVGLGDSIKAGFDTVVEWWNSDENTISGFFKRIWDTVTKWFTPSVDDRGFETYSPIVQFFYRIKNGVTEAFKDIKTWWSGSGIPQFFTRIWNEITKVFSPKVTDIYYDGSGRHEVLGNSPVVQFFLDTWEGVKKAFEEVKSWGIWSSIGTFFSGVWDTISGIFEPKLAGVYYDGTGRHAEYGNSSFVQFFVDTWEGIKNAFEEVRNWGIWNTIGTFFTGVWNTLSGIFKPKLTDIYYDSTGRHETYGSSPFAQFFISTWEGIKNAFEEVKGWQIWKTIGSFFNGVWNSISEVFAPKVTDIYYDGSGRHEVMGDSPIVKFFKDTWESIKSVFTEISEWWNDPENSISGFFKGIWESITGFFDGAGEVAESVDETSQKVNDAAGQATKGGEGKTEKSVGIITQLITTIKGFITEVFDKIAGVEIPPEVTKFFNGLTDFFLGVAKVFGEIMGAVGRVLQGNGSDGDWAIVIFGAIVAALTKLVDFLNTKNLAKIETQSFSQKFMSMAIGLLAIAAAVSLLTTIDQGKMWTAVGALTVLGVVIGAILYFSNNIQMIGTVQAAQSTVTERLLGKLMDTLKVVGSIAVIMALLPPVIEAFGKAKQLAPELSGLDVMGIMTSIVIAITGISAGLALIDSLTGRNGLDPLAAIKSAAALIGFIGVIAVGLLGAGGLLELIDGIVDTIGGEDVDTIGALQGALDKVSALVEGIGGVLYGFFSGLFGIQTDTEKQNAAMENLNALADVSDKFSLETTSGILRIMAMVSHLTELSKDIDVQKMDDFETAMEQMARGILKFSWIFEGIDGIEGIGTVDSDRYKNFQGAIDLVQQTLDSFSGLKGFGEMGSQSMLSAGIKDFIKFANNDETLQAFVDGVNKVLSSFGGLDDGSNVNFEGVKIIQSMYDAIQMAFTDPSANLPEFDATPIVDSIIKAIGLGESAIALAVHSMVQEGLNASETGEGGEGYTFDPSEALKFFQNPVDMSAITGNMDQYKEMLYGKGGSSENPGKDSIMGLFMGFSSDIDNMEIPNIADKIKGSMSMTNEDGTPIDLVGDLRETLTSFEEELNETTSFEIKIVPTYDFSNLNAEVLRNELRDYPINLPFWKSGGFEMPGMLQVDFSGINTALDLDGLKNRLDIINTSVGVNGAATVDAIERMGSHIDSISAAIAQIRVVVDMYGLIPAIDKALGERAAKSTVTGVSSMLSNPYAYVNKPETK